MSFNLLSVSLVLIKVISGLIGSWTDHWSAWINCSSWAGRLPQLDWKHLDPPPRPETRRSKRLSSSAHRTAPKSIHANFSFVSDSEKGQRRILLTWLLCLREELWSPGAGDSRLSYASFCRAVSRKAEISYSHLRFLLCSYYLQLATSGSRDNHCP